MCKNSFLLFVSQKDTWNNISRFETEAESMGGGETEGNRRRNIVWGIFAYFFTLGFWHPALEQCTAQIINTGWVISPYSAGAVSLKEYMSLLPTDKSSSYHITCNAPFSTQYSAQKFNVTCCVTTHEDSIQALFRLENASFWWGFTRALITRY